MWSGSFDIASEREIYFLITWARTLTFTQFFCQRKEKIVGKIHAFENYNGLPVANWTLHVRALFIFSAGYFSLLAVIHFILRWYRFTDGIRKNCKEVVDLRFVHPNAPHCLAYFSQNSQIRNWCINWWKLS